MSARQSESFYTNERSDGESRSEGRFQYATYNIDIMCKINIGNTYFIPKK